MVADKARFWLYDSLLSEFAALGFEYGYSVVNKDALVIWEAQFGDFMNGAEVIIDQFLVAAEDKWDQTSGLVLLLPHGRIQRAIAPTITRPAAGSIHHAKALRPAVATGTKAVGFIDITSLPLYV
jgi:hypothetical protein